MKTDTKNPAPETWETPPVDVDELIRQAMTRHTDAAKITAAVLKKIPDVDLRYVLREVLPAYVLKRNSRARGRLHRGESQQANRRWQGDIMRTPVFVGGREPKDLGDCTKADVLAAAEVRNKRMERELRLSKCYRRLADLMDATGAEKVGDLDPEDITDIFRP